MITNLQSSVSMPQSLQNPYTHTIDSCIPKISKSTNNCFREVKSGETYLA